MKKLAVFAMVLILLLGSVPVRGAQALGLEEGLIHTKREDGTAEIFSYILINFPEDLRIPSKIGGVQVTSIGIFALCNNPSLRTAVIPEGVTDIGNGALSNCASLEEVTLPDSVTQIGKNPFFGCVRLKRIGLSAEHAYLALVGGVLFSKPDKRLVCYPCTLPAARYAIPNGTRIVDDYAFMRCFFPEEIVIPDTVEVIGAEAFEECTFLTAITVPGSVKDIGYRAFSNCRRMTEAVIRDGVERIGHWAFSSCRSLRSVSLPDSVTSIGVNVFAGCSEDLVVTVGADSYAMQYCVENKIAYAVRESAGWLTE